MSSTPIKMGVRQRCPLSMLLFSIGIDPVLSTLEENDSFGIMTEAGKITCLAYADDIALIAPDHNTLHEIVNVANRLVSWTSMKFNASKCGYLPVQQEADSIFIEDSAIPIVTNEEDYRYLGVDFTRKTKNTPEKLFKDLIRDLKKNFKVDLVSLAKTGCLYDFFYTPDLYFSSETTTSLIKSYRITATTTRLQLCLRAD